MSLFRLFFGLSSCASALQSVEAATYNGYPSFTRSYQYDGTGHVIIGKEPLGNATNLPVFIFFGGTGDLTGAPVHVNFLEAMAARGFIAAEVDYPNTLDELTCKLWFGGGFEGFLEMVDEKAGKVFPAALDAVCTHPRADCSSGVAVTGHSQGGYLTQMSVKHSGGRVTAIMPLGIGCDSGTDELIGATKDAGLAPYLAKNKRLILTGTKDGLWNEGCLQQMSGYGSARTDIIGPGYMAVPNGAHSFHSEHAWSTMKSMAKCLYRDTKAAWGWNSALDWLGQTASPSKFVAVSNYTGIYSSGCSNMTLSQEPLAPDAEVPFPACIVWFIICCVLLSCCCCCSCVFCCYQRKVCCFKEWYRIEN